MPHWFWNTLTPNGCPKVFSGINGHGVGCDGSAYVSFCVATASAIGAYSGAPTARCRTRLSIDCRPSYRGPSGVSAYETIVDPVTVKGSPLYQAVAAKPPPSDMC